MSDFINPSFDDLCKLHPELVEWREAYLASCARADKAEAECARLRQENIALRSDLSEAHADAREWARRLENEMA